MDRRRPLLIIGGEFRTDAARREAAAALGYGIHARVSVADALRVEAAELPTFGAERSGGISDLPRDFSGERWQA